MKIKNFFKGYIGDKAFYKSALAIALPMIIQNVVTNLVNMLDNIMVGSLGSEEFAAVGAVNQFIFVFNLAVFGAISGAGIFTAQYNGRGDHNGVKNTMRIKLVTCVVLGILGVSLFSVFGDFFIGSFLESGEEINVEEAFSYAQQYLVYILIGLIPFAISQSYASTLRETGQTVVPMIAGFASVITNFLLNLLLIFGVPGMPGLGVVGAAIATSTSRFVELVILVIWTHKNKAKCPFIVDIFKKFRVPSALTKQVVIKGVPILLNELLWSLSITFRNMCYVKSGGDHGAEVLNAINVSFSLQNLLSVAYFALSSSIAIMVGNLLGAGKLKEAKETDKKLLAFSVFMGMIMMGVQIGLSGVFPTFFKITDLEKELAGFTMICFAITMPAAALATSTYYTIRSGGLAFVTMLFDSVYAWVLVAPVAAALAYFTNIGFKELLIIVLIVENLKLLPGLIMVEKGIWVKQIKVE